MLASCLCVSKTRSKVRLGKQEILSIKEILYSGRHVVVKLPSPSVAQLNHSETRTRNTKTRKGDCRASKGLYCPTAQDAPEGAGTTSHELKESRAPFSSAKLTLIEMAANLHGWFPLAILTRQVFVITLQHVAFGTQVLDDTARVQGVSAGPGMADIATILWLWRQGTHCKDKDREMV